jgi:general secretion pathway protein H
MWAPGNRTRRCPQASPGGFTLLELLLVVALIAVASAGVAFSLRESGEQLLEREALRLVARLDAARAQSRASGNAIVWRPDGDGYVFIGSAGSAGSPEAPIPWLEPGTRVRDDKTLVLGPEPIIGAQAIELVLGDRSLRVATDGLRPFAVVPEGDRGIADGRQP